MEDAEHFLIDMHTDFGTGWKALLEELRGVEDWRSIGWTSGDGGIVAG